MAASILRPDAPDDEGFSPIPLSDEVGEEDGGSPAAPRQQSRTYHFLVPSILASVLVLGLLGAVAWSQARQATSTAPTQLPRLLESSDLVELCVDNAIAFHNELSQNQDPVSAADLEPESRSELEGAVRERLQELLDKISATDPEAGRLLRDTRPSQQVWKQTQTLMEAMHDKRVRELGVQALLAANASADAEGRHQLISQYLEQHQDNLRQLKDELLPTIHSPADVKGQKHWEVAGKVSGFGLHMEVAGWAASLTMTKPVAVAERTLRSLSKGRRLVFGMALGNLILWVPIALAIILPILTLVMTIVTGPIASRIWLSIEAAVAATTCAYATAIQTTLRNVGPVNFRPLWFPCGFNVAILGLETIWTFRK